MASGYMFSHYFPGDGIQGTEPPAPLGYYAYPIWFDGAALGLNITWPHLHPRLKKQIRGIKERLIRRLPYRLVILPFLWRALRSPEFSRAIDVVRGVAKDPQTRTLKWWSDVDRLAVSNPQWGENMYRALAARTRFGDRSPEAALLLELAYLAYKRKRS